MVGYDIHLPAIIKCLDIFMSLKGALSERLKIASSKPLG